MLRTQTPICDTMLVYMQLEEKKKKADYERSCADFCRSVKGVFLHFRSPVEVLFVYLPEYDSACIRADFVSPRKVCMRGSVCIYERSVSVYLQGKSVCV